MFACPGPGERAPPSSMVPSALQQPAGLPLQLAGRCRRWHWMTGAGHKGRRALTCLHSDGFSQRSAKPGADPPSAIHQLREPGTGEPYGYGALWVPQALCVGAHGSCTKRSLVASGSVQVPWGTCSQGKGPARLRTSVDGQEAAPQQEHGLTLHTPGHGNWEKGLAQPSAWAEC